MNAETAHPGLLPAAFALAVIVHSGQKRKASEVPYLGHLLGVTELVLNFGGTDVETAAALLHDAVEDGGGLRRLADIETACGAEVAAIVKSCTDSTVDVASGAEKRPWFERKREYISHLASAEARDGALLVSACDKLHNLAATHRDYADQGDSVWTRFKTGWAGQVWYYRQLLSVYRNSDDPRTRRAADHIGAELDAFESVLRDDGYDLDRLDDLMAGLEGRS